MDTPEHEPTPLVTDLEAGEQRFPANPARKYPVRKLSPSVKAFVARMAENLRTHDPENPKGRLRRQP